MAMDAEMQRELSRIERRLVSVESVPIKQMAFEVQLSGIEDDVKRLSDKFDKWTEKEDRKELSLAAERKSDRRWMIGAVLSAATIIIGALAVLIPALTGG